ncbi:MAG: hypothetical protein DI598_13185 [Pseudopedobacter saltans]|uniref:DUF3857 domain-containing protein n=1 Tax=Pseudopedobacter saltans TaxID=151895 RepID=A0A2W5EVB0_9SPHI|nr:MAG: hypothetical protein DI598_13185 [Pseudopedobacter saltans]
MTRLFFCICTFLLLLITSSSIGQSEYRVSDIPKELLTNAVLIVRKEDRTIEMRSANDVRIHTIQAFTILNEKDKDLASLTIGYYKNKKIDNVKGFLYDADGNLIRKFGIKDMQDQSAVSSFSLYEDSRIKYFEPVSISYPITVVYDYTVQLLQNLIIPDWIPKYKRNIAVQESKYSFICRENDSIQIKEENLVNGHTENHIDKRQKMYSWVVSNLPAEREEPLAPPYIKDRITVKLVPTNFYYYKYTGNSHNWNELGKWFYNSLVKDQQTPTQRMVDLVNKTKKEQSSSKQIVKSLYKYLQDNFRYVSVQIGIGGFRPMSATEVDSKGYGDCKALVNYMQTLLNLANIPSYYCVVESGTQKIDMYTDFASLDQGDHVILMVPLKKDTMWLECTSSKIPAGFLGDFTDDRKVWASNKDTGFIVRTPTYTTMQNSQLQDGHFIMDMEGTLRGNLKAVYRGTQFDNIMSILDLSEPERVKKLTEAYSIDKMQINNVNFKIESDSEIQLLEELNLELPHNAAKNGNTFYFKLNLFNRTSVPPFVRNRKLPLYFSRGYVDEDSVTIKLPESVHLESGSVEKSVKSIFGSYRVEIKEENGYLKFYRKIERNEGQFSPEKYEEYIDFMTGLDDLDSRKLILSVK